MQALRPELLSLRPRLALRVLASALAALAALAGPASAGPVGAAVAPSSATRSNANFDGTWDAGYVADPAKRATMIIEGEDLATGDFQGTVVPPAGGGRLSDGNYEIEDGKVSGNQFKFEIERDDIGSDDATYTAYWSGSITDNSVEGYIDAALSPTPEGCGSGTSRALLPSAAHGPGARQDDADCDLGGDFTATRLVDTLKGEVTSGCSGGGGACPYNEANGLPIADITVKIDGDNGSATVTTDDKGRWSADLPDGRYTVKPDDSGFSFTPADRDVDLDKSTGAQDFTGCAQLDQSDDQSSNASPSSSDHATRDAGALAYDLSGTNCNETFSVSDVRGSSSVVFHWKTDAFVCVGTGTDNFGEKYVAKVSGAKGSIKPLATRSGKKTAGAITSLVLDSATDPVPQDNPVIRLSVAPSLQSGSVAVIGKSQAREYSSAKGEGNCWPPAASIPLK